MKDAPPQKAEGVLRYGNKFYLLFLACLQNSLGSGLLFGWSGIAGSMMVAPASAGGAGLALQETAGIFARAIFLFYLGNLSLGLVLDKFGPRICSFISHMLVCTGCAIVAISNTYPKYVLGFSVLAFGGPGVQVSTVHLGNLFPINKNFVVTFVTSTFTLSVAIFPFFNKTWSVFKFSISSIFGVYAVIIFTMAILSAFIWPDTPYLSPLDTERAAAEKNESLAEKLRIQKAVAVDNDRTMSMDQFTEEFDEYHQVIAEVSKNSRTRENIKNQQEVSFFSQLKSGTYLRTFFFFLVTTFCVDSYTAVISLEFVDQNKFDPETRQELLSSFAYINSVGIIFAPLIGYSLNNLGFVFTAVVALLLGILQIILRLVYEDVKGMILLSFWIFALFASSIFSYFYAYLSTKLGYQHYGKLLGFAFAISGICQLFVLPLSKWARATCNADGCSEGKWNQLNVITMMSLFILLLIPCLDAFEDKADETENKRKTTITLESETLLSETKSLYST